MMAPTMDFSGLPPEINSARIYSGPGSGPLLTTAAAWDQLARELAGSASASRSAVAALVTDSWRGPASTAMAAAAGPYITWLHATAAQAEHTAGQVRVAAAAYQAALGATVPPPLIEANRIRLQALIASNFFGQNSPAIAATEAEYEQMWAQDAAAMHGYAASATSATGGLAQFAAPPTVTAPESGAATAGAAPAVDPTSLLNASTLLSLVLDLPSLTSAAASTSSSTFSGIAIQTTNHALAVNAMRDAHQGIGPFIAGVTQPAVTAASPSPRVVVGPSAVTAATGRASLAGSLSVPQSWAAAEVTPASPTAAPAIPASSSGVAPATAPRLPAGPPPGVFGEAMLGTLAGRGVNNAAVKARRSTVIPRSPAAG